MKKVQFRGSVKEGQMRQNSLLFSKEKEEAVGGFIRLDLAGYGLVLAFVIVLTAALPLSKTGIIILTAALSLPNAGVIVLAATLPLPKTESAAGCGTDRLAESAALR